MIGARGVALGLGRVNLNDLRSLRTPAQRQLDMNKRKQEEKEKPRIIIKKRVDRQTLWAACRAVVFGTILIVLGMAMATIGYYAEQFAKVQTGTFGNETSVDPARKLQFASLSYVGPVVMGVGAFILMIACVMTLESRDKHARLIHEYPREGSTRRPSTGHPTEEEKLLNSALGNNAGQGEANNNMTTEKNKEDPPPPYSQHVNEEAKNITNSTGKGTRCVAGEGDSGPFSTATTTLSLSRSVKDREWGKFPSTSCLDALVKQTDTQALLQRFQHDHQGRSSKSGANTLKKQSNSLEIHGSKKILVAQRNVRSEEMPIRHSTVAEVHPPPSIGGSSGEKEFPNQNPSPCPSTSALKDSITLKARPPGVKKGRRSPIGRAPLVRPESAEPPDNFPDLPSPMSFAGEDLSPVCQNEPVYFTDTQISVPLQCPSQPPSSPPDPSSSSRNSNASSNSYVTVKSSMSSTQPEEFHSGVGSSQENNNGNFPLVSLVASSFLSVTASRETIQSPMSPRKYRSPKSSPKLNSHNINRSPKTRRHDAPKYSGSEDLIKPHKKDDHHHKADNHHKANKAQSVSALTKAWQGM